MPALRNRLKAVGQSLALGLLGVLVTPLVQAERPRPAIVDTDVAADDLVALLYLLHSPEMRLVGITTVNGVASPEAGARNVLRVLAAAGRGGMPVVVGAEKPLAGEQAFPEAWRESAERLEGVDLPPAKIGELPNDAPHWLLERIEESSEGVSILALGPLTNIAQALAEAPDLCRHVERIVWLGGAAFVRGNVDAWPQGASERHDGGREWNAYIDPEAARRVLASGCSVEMVPLDVVYELPLRAAVVTALERNANSPAARIGAQLLRRLLASPWQDGQSYAADALAALVLAHPSLAEKRRFEVRVIAEGEQSGETRIVRRSRRANASVILHINLREAEKRLMERLAGGAGMRNSQ